MSAMIATRGPAIGVAPHADTTSDATLEIARKSAHTLNGRSQEWRGEEVERGEGANGRRGRERAASQLSNGSQFRFDSPPPEYIAAHANSFPNMDPQVMENIQQMSQAQQAKADRKLYLGNLPTGVTSQQLQENLNQTLVSLKANLQVGGSEVGGRAYHEHLDLVGRELRVHRVQDARGGERRVCAERPDSAGEATEGGTASHLPH